MKLSKNLLNIIIFFSVGLVVLIIVVLSTKGQGSQSGLPTPSPEVSAGPAVNWQTVNVGDFTVKRRGTETPLANRYAMVITVTSVKDFTGEIADTLPEGAKIVWQGPAEIANQIIVWSANLKKDEPQEFKYEYEAIPPFEIGPVLINNQAINNYVEIP